MKSIFRSLAMFVLVVVTSGYTCQGQQGPTPPSVSLTWSQGVPPSGKTISFNCVYRGSVAQVYTIPALFCSSTPISSYTDTSVVRGSTYHYAVTATITGLAESGFSNDAPAAVPAQPGGITPPGVNPTVDAKLEAPKQKGVVTDLFATVTYDKKK